MNKHVIILRRDMQRAKNRIKYHFKRGKQRAILEHELRVDKVTLSLRGKVDFKRWREHEAFSKQTELIIVAIVKEFGANGIHENLVVAYFHQVMIAGTLDQMVSDGELSMSREKQGLSIYTAR